MKINMGRRIREKRMETGLTQLELATKLNIDARTISSWENNRTEPKMFQVQQMCKILDCDEYELTGMQQTVEAYTLSQTDKTILELYNKLSAENKNKLLLYMIELGREDD